MYIQICVLLLLVAIDRPTWATFWAQAPKRWKNPHWNKNFSYFGKWNFLALVLKNFLIFYYIWEIKNHKKLFIFEETETVKSFLYFRKRNFSAQAQKMQNSNPKKKSGKETFLPQKNLIKLFKNFLYPKNFIKLFYTSSFYVAYETPCHARGHRSHLIFATDRTQCQTRCHHFHFLPNSS